MIEESRNGHEADLYFGPRGPNGRGGLVREMAPYVLAGDSLSCLTAATATRFKRVPGEPSSRPELQPMDASKAC